MQLQEVWGSRLVGPTPPLQRGGTCTQDSPEASETTSEGDRRETMEATALPQSRYSCAQGRREWMEERKGEGWKPDG